MAIFFCRVVRLFLRNYILPAQWQGRAERRLWTLHRQAPLNEDILRFVNRLSDLFFVMARTEMQRQDWPEEKWQDLLIRGKDCSFS